MRRARFSKIRFVLMAVAALFLAGQASADDKHSGNAKVPMHFAYPKGAKLTQTYAQPSGGVSSLAAFNSSPGTVNPSASMSVLYQQAATRKLVEKQCVALPRGSVQVRLGEATAGLVGGPQVLHKFGYGLQYKDIPLSKHTSQSLVIASRGNQRKVLFSRARNLPDPENLPADTTATVEQETATRIGLGDAKKGVGDVNIEVAMGDANQAPHLEIVVGDQGKAELAWTYVVRANDRKDRFARQYWVAAQGDAHILLKEDLVYMNCWQEPSTAVAPAATKGKITGDIFGIKKSPLDAPDTNQPLQDFLAESVIGHQVVTDSTGQYTPVPGVALNKMLIGPFARVINEAGPALNPTQDGNNLTFKATNDQELAQVSAFYWVNFAHEFVKPFLPGTLTVLANMDVHVNINETCNAFFSGADNSLNFFKAGKSIDDPTKNCVNSAYCDVACHEFGHGVDAEFGDILDGAYSEGFGDSLAILITETSVIGRDFFGSGTKLRDASDPIQWPDVKDDFDPHVAGQPYACFTWDLSQKLISKFGGDGKKAFDTVKQLTLGAAALNPRDVPDAVRLVFFVDHQNGSKFFQEMAQAADAHQIPRPSTPDVLNNPVNLNVASQ
jgi:hypothetical protein